MRRDPRGFGHVFFRLRVNRGASDRGATRAASALAEEHAIGIAVHVADVVRIEAEPVANDLLEHGFVALTLRDRAGEQRGRARAIESDLGCFEAWRGRLLDSDRNADTPQLA